MYLQKGGVILTHRKTSRKRIKPQGKSTPRKTKTLKNAKVKVEFLAATMPEGAFYGQDAVATIIASILAAVVSILK